MCEVLVDLLNVNVRDAESKHPEMATIHFECRVGAKRVGYPECGVVTRVKDRHAITLSICP